VVVARELGRIHGDKLVSIALHPGLIIYHRIIYHILTRRSVGRSYQDGTSAPSTGFRSVAPCSFTHGFYSFTRSNITYKETFLFYPIEYGAITQLYAGTAPQAAEYNGKVRSSTIHISR
jgi:hypothetical protein